MQIRAAVLLALFAAPAAAFAVEGKWTPEQVLEHDPAWLRELGLEIPPQELWSREGGGLLEAAVRIDTCSGGFVSARGLVITNHHCVFRILQQHSTPERDLITRGFLARTPADELPGPGTRATLPRLLRKSGPSGVAWIGSKELGVELSKEGVAASPLVGRNRLRNWSRRRGRA